MKTRVLQRNSLTRETVRHTDWQFGPNIINIMLSEVGASEIKKAGHFFIC